MRLEHDSGNLSNNELKGEVNERESQFTQEFVDEALKDSIRWIIWYFRRLVQAGELYSKELTKKYRVSQPQLSCILALHEYGPLSLSKLATYILVKPSTVTGIIDRLEQKDLVRRQRSAADRRVITIELTPAGQKLAIEAPPPIPESIVDSVKKLSPEERKRIVKSLATLVAMLEDDGLPNSSR